MHILFIVSFCSIIQNHQPTIHKMRRCWSSIAKGRRVQDFRSDTVTRPTAAMFNAMANASLSDDVLDVHLHPPLLNTVRRVDGESGAIRRGSVRSPSSVVLRDRNNVQPNRSHDLPYAAGVCGVGRAISCEPIRECRPGYAFSCRIHPHLAPWTLVDCVGFGKELGPRRYPLCRNACCVIGEHAQRRHHAPLRHPVRPFLWCVMAREISDFCQTRKAKLHLDGARLWNASAETGVPMYEWCRGLDTVSLCLSKGIGAPIGSILVGTHLLMS
jgi:threonine aldolase